MKWIIFGVLVVAVFGIVLTLGKSGDTTFNGDATKIITEGPIADYVYGNPEGKVVLIEYGDYQCPGCGAVYEPIKALTEKYKSKLTFIFRNLPLTNSHPNALATATAAEAAGLQGKYYEMHDVLYATQSSWRDATVDQRGSIFENYASQIGLDLNKFRQDLTSADIAAKIRRDKATAIDKFAAQGTPTFVINGEVIKGQDAVNIDLITQKVEAALKAVYGAKALDIKAN